METVFDEGNLENRIDKETGRIPAERDEQPTSEVTLTRARRQSAALSQELDT